MENKMIENFRGIVNGVEYNDVLSFVQALEEQSGKPNNVIRKSLKLPLIKETPCNCGVDECATCHGDKSVEQKTPEKKRIYSRPGRPGIYETDEWYIIPSVTELNLNALLTENDLEKFDYLLEDRLQYLNQLLHSDNCELDFNVMITRINELKSQVNIWLGEALKVKNYFTNSQNKPFKHFSKYFENYNNLQKGLSSLVGYLDCIYDVCIKEKESKINEDFLRFADDNNFSNEICSTFLMLGLRNE